MDAHSNRQLPTLDADIKSLQRELHERLSAAKKVESKGSSVAEQQLVSKAK